MQYVATWGANDLNQLNLPFNRSDLFFGNLITGFTGLTKLALGEYHSIGIYNNSYLTGWGDNRYDQISFKLLPDFHYYIGAQSLDANQGTSYLVDKFGYIHGYGRDLLFGSIDTGNIIDWNFYLNIGLNPTPFAISKYPKDFSLVSAGSGFVLGLHRSGFITGWGNSGSSVISGQKYLDINSLGFVTGVSAGFDHALAMLSGGTVTGWGDNFLNQLNFDTSIFSGIKISTKANHNLVLGRPKPIITKIDKNNSNWIVDFSGVNASPTAFVFQRSINKQNWVSINGSIVSNGKIQGNFFPNEDQDYFCRLIEQKNSNFYTGSIANFNPYYFYFNPSKDSKLYNWGGVRIDPLNTIQFFPAMGNIDYLVGAGYTSPPTHSGSLYLNYFNNLLGDLVDNTSSNKRYYEVVIGDCHFFILDSDPVTGGGGRDGNTSKAGIGDPSSPGSNIDYANTQKNWFNNRIQNSKSKWKLVIFHHPPRSSSASSYGSFNLSFENGWRLDLASAVFNGHSLIYEKFLRNHNGKEVYYFAVGPGGRRISDLGPLLPDSFTQLQEYGFTKIKVYDEALEVCFNTLGGTEKDNTLIGGNERLNLKNIFAIVADFGERGNPTDIISIGADYFFPISNYYTNQVSLSIKDISPDAVFTAGNNVPASQSILNYEQNIEPFYKSFYTGNVMIRNEITDIPERIKNVNIYDANAGYKTNIVLTEIPLATGTPPPPIISGESVSIVCQNFIFDDDI
jgi:hypothetical protein